MVDPAIREPRPSLAALGRLVRAVDEVDPSKIESAARELGRSRAILAPIGWAAGTLVLLFAGMRLLITNWRLSLIQLIPATWVWLAFWDLKRHLLQGGAFREFPLPVLMAIAAAVMALTVVAFWCNTIFAFAVDGPPPPRIRPAAAQARQHGPEFLAAGLIIGAALAFTVVFLPRIAGVRAFTAVMGLVLGAMVISFVAVPARIIGVKKRRLPLTESVGRVAAGGALAAVAMAPGYFLGRIGLLLLGLQHFHLLGFALLSIGTALYAAGMSSVKAITLSMKLTQANAD